MLGGDRSFGAGGWIDSETAKAIPVRLDPPQERQLTRGALALIMHSTEMPRANFWAQQTAIAAIEALKGRHAEELEEWGRKMRALERSVHCGAHEVLIRRALPLVGLGWAPTRRRCGGQRLKVSAKEAGEGCGR